MKAYFSHGTYSLFVDPQSVPALYRNELEAFLYDQESNALLNKKIILSKDPSGQGDIQYQPPEADWDGLREIKVLLSKDCLESLVVTKSAVQRISTGNVHVSIEDTSGLM